MRITRLLIAAVAIALTPSALAADYQELRAREPVVDASIAALPSSGFHGAMHRIDSTYRQPRVASLAPGAYEAIPPVSLDRLMDAFEDLERMLRAGLSETSLQDRFVLAQVVDVIGFRRLTELHQGFPAAPAGGGVIVSCPDEYRWGRECHSFAQKTADQVAELFENSLREAFDRWELDHPASAPLALPPVSNSAISSTNLGQWLHDIAQSDAGRATGVEHIDY